MASYCDWTLAKFTGHGDGIVNPGGVVEETGATARTFIDALKGQPATLALAIANLGMLIFIFYALTKAADFRDKMLTNEQAFAKHVTELLAKCVVPTTYTSEPLKPLGEAADPHKGVE